MKLKSLLFILIFSSIFSFNAQEKKKETSKDTVKTEVVEVITSYNPKIIDASKIKKNPTIKILKTTEKKKLEYKIFSVPVASTFIPRTGVVKGIDVGVKERIYKNYLAAGFGNYNTPFAELYLHHSTRFENEFGVYVKYLSANEKDPLHKSPPVYGDAFFSVLGFRTTRYRNRFQWVLCENEQYLESSS